jgi:3D (Asp-Asp-Asp) domain-containing protein
MSNRMNNTKSMFKLAGVASLVLFVGATVQPMRNSGIAAKAVITPVIAPAVPVTPAARPAELMHDAAPAAATLAPAAVAKKLRTIRMEVTAYCPCTKCCGENAQGITASGHDVSYNNSRFVAADTEHLPFGTKLVIPGYAGGAVEVIDRGGAIKGHKLDVFYPTHEEALQWGRQWVEVTVLQ